MGASIGLLEWRKAEAYYRDVAEQLQGIPTVAGASVSDSAPLDGTKPACPFAPIQTWLGNKNLETTMIYLGVRGSEKLRGNINKAFGD